MRGTAGVSEAWMEGMRAGDGPQVPLVGSSSAGWLPSLAVTYRSSLSCLDDGDRLILPFKELGVLVVGAVVTLCSFPPPPK